MQSTPHAAAATALRPADARGAVRTWPIVFIVGLLLGASALFLLIGGVDQGEFEARTGMAWADLAAAQPQVADYISGLFRTVGLMAGGFALFGAALGITAFRRGERWAWLTAWIMPLFYGYLAAGMLARGSGVGYFYGAITVLLALALLLPWRQFFPKE